MASAQQAHREAVDADASVQKEEQHEVLVVMKADAGVDPDAVMVELLTATSAHAAMLRPGWLR